LSTINPLKWLFKKGRQQQKREAYNDARKRFRQILDRTREADWVERANAGLAEVYLAEGNLFWAMDHVRRAIKRNPRSGQYRYLKGKIHYQREEWRQAADEAIKAVETDSKSGRFYHLLARSLEQTGDHREARRYYEWALRYQPEDLNIRFDLVAYEIKQGSFQTALQCLKEGLEIHEDSDRLRDKIRAIQENWKITGN